jgi:beta-glucanase (GH16 family)
MMKDFKILPFLAMSVLLFSCGKTKDDKPAPQTNSLLSVTDVKMERANKDKVLFHFVVNVENLSSNPITVNYTTVDGTAKAGIDYVTRTGSLTIAANQSGSVIDVEVTGDSTRMEDKIFYVQLSNPVNAKLFGAAKGTGTIMSNGTWLSVDNTGYSTPVSYPGYSLKWSDEFDGNKLNTASWNYESGGGGWGNNELQNYTSSPKNSFVTSGGYLVIEARKETIGTNQYSSARLTTYGKKDFTYGRIDIRAKLPKGQGVWPALWMLGRNIGTTPWPASGEIDIMELLGHQPNKTYGTIHWGNVGGQSTHIGGEYILPAADFYSTFHVFTFLWTSDKMEWYIDDVKFYTANKSQVTGNYPFDKPFFFIFNVAVGGNWPGNPDATTVLPQRMIVDYIRVFQ